MLHQAVALVVPQYRAFTPFTPFTPFASSSSSPSFSAAAVSSSSYFIVFFPSLFWFDFDPPHPVSQLCTISPAASTSLVLAHTLFVRQNMASAPSERLGHDLTSFLGLHSFSEHAHILREQTIRTVSQLSELEWSDLHELGIPKLAAKSMIRKAKQRQPTATPGRCKSVTLHTYLFRSARS